MAAIPYAARPRRYVPCWPSAPVQEPWSYHLWGSGGPTGSFHHPKDLGADLLRRAADHLRVPDAPNLRSHTREAGGRGYEYIECRAEWFVPIQSGERGQAVGQGKPEASFRLGHLGAESSV